MHAQERNQYLAASSVRQHRIGSQRRGGDGTRNRFFLIKDDCLKKLFML